VSAEHPAKDLAEFSFGRFGEGPRLGMLGHHEYPVQVGIVDLDSVAVTQVRDATCRTDAQLPANRAAGAIRGEQIVGMDHRQRTAVKVLDRCRHARCRRD
jgi:hypothetical protein